jgi:hypothetical protein
MRRPFFPFTLAMGLKIPEFHVILRVGGEISQIPQPIPTVWWLLNLFSVQTFMDYPYLASTTYRAEQREFDKTPIPWDHEYGKTFLGITHPHVPHRLEIVEFHEMILTGNGPNVS